MGARIPSEKPLGVWLGAAWIRWPGIVAILAIAIYGCLDFMQLGSVVLGLGLLAFGAVVCWFVGWRLKVAIYADSIVVQNFVLRQTIPLSMLAGPKRYGPEIALERIDGREIAVKAVTDWNWPKWTGFNHHSRGDRFVDAVNEAKRSYDNRHPQAD